MNYINNFNKYKFLLGELVKKGIRLKYRRSYLGIVWSLIEPILTTIVLVIVFGTLFQNKDPMFPLYIIIGRLIYSSFSSGTKAASKSIRANASMIKKVYVPKYLYPVSSVLFNFIIFAISLIVVVLVDIYCKVVPTYHILMFIPGIMLLLILTLGVGFILATLNVFFRDIEYLWNVILMIIMYMCAIFYPAERLLKSGYSWILNINPLYHIITICRNAVMGKPVDVDGLIYTIVFCFMSLIIGFVFFRKNQDKFILHI